MLTRWTRRVAVTCGAVVGFVLLYEATVLDSRYAARQALLRETSAQPAPGARLRFTATAYCKGQLTASGVRAQAGVAAADPDLLPVGSVVHVDGVSPRYNGVYTVMDTGPRVRGRHIDLYTWSCYEALDFGRRDVVVTVLRLGWNPRASLPTFLGGLLRRTSTRAPAAPATAPPPLPSRSLPLQLGEPRQP